MSNHLERENISPANDSESSLQKWKTIQICAVLPLILSVVLLFRFQGSVLGTIVFFLILIIGIILPQVYRDIIQSHLRIEDELEELRQQLRSLQHPS